MVRRATVARPVTVSGTALHSGRSIRLTLEPGAPGRGIVFVRSDLDGLEIPARLDRLSGAAWATTLTDGGASVGTVEHLLSAVAGLGIDDLRVRVDGAEVPILDGSARPFVELLEAAGRVESSLPRLVLRVESPVTVREGDRWIAVEPARGCQVRYLIDFDHPLIGRSERSFTLRPDQYARDIAPARTFCRLEDVDRLREAGLALGGSLDNAVVVDRERILNPPLRFDDEFVRHKILDLIGDLALLGAPLEGRVTASLAGHALHARLMSKLLARRTAWSLVPADGTSVPARTERPLHLPAPAVPLPA
jgi:UDP-3-O-[3-hydroxymyristoyl] N-acetylglucosamine deacetylase